MPPDSGAQVTRDGLTLERTPSGVVDVYFDDHRAFSAAPMDFRGERPSFLPWPGVLLPYLQGQTRVVVRRHGDGVVLLDRPVQFDPSDIRVAIRDAAGRPLAVDKFGNLARMFSGMETETARQLASTAGQLMRDVNEFGVGGFLAYGSLLGAVRSGHLIGHDTDLDIAYLSNHEDPASVALESFALERFLEGRGWSMRRLRVGLVRAVFRDAAGDERHVDVFTAMHDGESFYLDKYVYGRLDREAVLPQGKVELEGVSLPAPADPHRLLELTYGPSYLVPDPSFRYSTPRSLRRTAWAWMGNYRYLRGRWHDRLSGGRGPGRPSAFARQVAAALPAGATVVDVGCGRGPDALWFARQGHPVVGIDYVASALLRCNRAAEARSLPAEFRTASLLDLRQSLALATDVATRTEHRVVFSRNVLDVLEPEARSNFWLTVRLLLTQGGSLHLQFRTRDREQAVRDPGFRPLQPDRVLDEAARHGARVVSRDDRPGRCRLELTWTS